MPNSHPQEWPNSTFIQAYRQDQRAICAELASGLLSSPAFTAPKYLYDALGSRLFAAICELPEYYPTRTEAAIFEANLSDMASAIGPGATLIDLGAGNCAKAARLLPVLHPSQYVPVDISVEFLRDSVELLQRRFPTVRMTAVGLDFSSALDLPAAVGTQRRLFFYPGSSIGNFDPEQAVAFLRRLYEACDRDGGLLIGCDLIKDKQTLDAAYDDALGVTASFNLNLLLHLNRLLGANFDVRDWQHRGFYNPDRCRIEMHLEARRNLAVCWRGGERCFGEGERLHTENSYKYTRDGFVQLLKAAGFGDVTCWTDARGWFLVCHACAH